MRNKRPKEIIEMDKLLKRNSFLMEYVLNDFDLMRAAQVLRSCNWDISLVKKKYKNGAIFSEQNRNKV